MIIRNAILLAASGLALASCAVNSAAPINAASGKLVSYFDAKQELATTLQSQLGGGGAARTSSDLNAYRLVAINGPQYAIGSVLSAANTLDVMTRRCARDFSSLPIEGWAAMPRWTSTSNLNTDLGLPAPFRGVLDESSVDVGLDLSSESVFEITDLSQQFLARDELEGLVGGNNDCASFFADLDEPVYFVRGVVLGRETIRSAKSFAAGLNARVIEDPSGSLTLSFDRNGAFELTDNDAVPKFAIMAKLVPQPVTAAMEVPAVRRTTTTPSDGGERQSAPVRAPAGSPMGQPTMARPTAPSPSPRFRFTTERMSDEEVAALEGGPGN